jgi:hypothetical protein
MKLYYIQSQRSTYLFDIFTVLFYIPFIWLNKVWKALLTTNTERIHCVSLATFFGHSYVCWDIKRERERLKRYFVVNLHLYWDIYRVWDEKNEEVLFDEKWRAWQRLLVVHVVWILFFFFFFFFFFFCFFCVIHNKCQKKKKNYLKW